MMAPLPKAGIAPICVDMHSALEPTPDLSPPPSHGHFGLWSDRVKALLLLLVLALSGGAASLLSPGLDNDRGRTSIGGPAARTLGPAPALAALVSEQRTALPDAIAGGHGPAPDAPAVAALPLPSLLSPSHLSSTGTYRSAAIRPGHDARVPTGPPARLSA